MKKFLMVAVIAILVSVLFSDCKYTKDICMECTITIAGIEDVQPTFCGDRSEVNDKEAEFEEVVARENSIVGESASLSCHKYFE